MLTKPVVDITRDVFEIFDSVELGWPIFETEEQMTTASYLNGLQLSYLGGSTRFVKARGSRENIGKFREKFSLPHYDPNRQGDEEDDI